MSTTVSRSRGLVESVALGTLLALTSCAGHKSMGAMAAPSTIAHAPPMTAGPPGSPPPTATGPSEAGAYVADDGPGVARHEAPRERPGLGTSWGEHVSAPISFTPFVRASQAPWAEVALHYNDAEGAAAHAAYLETSPRPIEASAGDGSLSVALVDGLGRSLPGFHANGRTLVIGDDGERYRIVVRNATSARFEVVASVDGLDVIDGKPADPGRRGYLVLPHDVLVIDGFRTSDDEVAAFRFGRVADSYAASTSGDRNVGVIGLALFAEQGAVWSAPTRGEIRTRDTADPFPNRGYAMPPR